MDRHLPGGGVLLEMYGHDLLRADAARRLPGLAPELVECASVHETMGVLARAVMDALSRADEEAAAGICAFVEDALGHPRAHGDIASAVALTFIEPATLQRTAAGRRLWDRLPERIKRLLGP